MPSALSALRARRGFTLIELLTVLVLIGILASLTFPSLAGVIARWKTRSALNRLTGDLYYARMLAVREGERVVLKFEPDPACPHQGTGIGAKGYRIIVRGSPEREAKAVDFRHGDALLCVHTNQSDTLLFNSRGLQTRFTNRTVSARRGEVADSLRVTVMGRVYRFY